MRLVWHFARMGNMRGAYKILMGKSEGKRTLGRLRCRWEGKNKMDVKEMG